MTLARGLSAERSRELGQHHHSQGQSAYSYVLNNPINNTDPTGFECVGSNCASWGGSDQGPSGPYDNGSPPTYNEGDDWHTGLGDDCTPVGDGTFSCTGGGHSPSGSSPSYGPRRGPIDTTFDGVGKQTAGTWFDQTGGERGSDGSRMGEMRFPELDQGGALAQGGDQNKRYNKPKGPFKTPGEMAGEMAYDAFMCLMSSQSCSDLELVSMALPPARFGRLIVPGASKAIVRHAGELLAQAVLRGPELFHGFRIFGNKGLVGTTFNRNILLIEAEKKGAVPLRRLFDAFEAEARAAGANQISITGHAVINPGFTQGLARRYGYTFRQINEEAIEFFKVLSQ